MWSRVPSTITGSPAHPLLESPLRYCLSTCVGKKSTRLAFIKPIQIRKHSLHVSAGSAQRCYHHHPDSARPRDWVHHHCGGKKRTATKQRRHDWRLHRWGEQSGSFCWRGFSVQLLYCEQDTNWPLPSNPTPLLFFLQQIATILLLVSAQWCSVHLLQSISQKSKAKFAPKWIRVERSAC